MAQVLLAEADRRIGGFIAGILTEFGHMVTICADAAEVDARLAAGPIDVVLSDCLLPVGAAAGFGRDWRAHGIPTLSLTGRMLSAECGDQPPLPLVDKPFRFADLNAVLEAVAACTAEVPGRLPKAA